MNRLNVVLSVLNLVSVESSIPCVDSIHYQPIYTVVSMDQTYKLTSRKKYITT